jgi:magnesium-protoporphyrin O-methyltransferase
MEHSCQCQGIELKFDQKYVSKELEEYRRKGSKTTTLELIEALRAQGVQGLTLLDIGGGIGDIQHALLQSGVSSATDVEAATAYLEACNAEATRQGHADKIRHLRGDFVDLAEDIPPADVVTLDRVVCCYHDMTRLVALSSAKARKLYGLVYPRDEWWVRLGMSFFYNLRFWLQRNPFRVFVHPTEAVEALVRNSGLRPHFSRKMGPWQVVVFHRPH